ncbi:MULTISPECIES: GNAT family N-acetyltransferase [Streptomyces]|uniref:GNAT family N-acetyltransferase n=1 Tax=Streptomyces morookaense TaxID=1970 RepID=A0A7Y7E9H5_STRMO|nr:MULTISPECIES: GNAT family N-acetyltransferase [Streptomyces]MCC2279138.1 GNAT family N-acetyltransferase [Streptomyces sp. ET3-23]NVK80431.1 GNAT family N-acetyltransferase [Streptomyces morookaense]GHF14057.1 putative acetyltransferase [Streptomyces morookaense]
MIRSATPGDVPAVHAMIRELAAYERALEHAKASEEQLREALFGEHPAAFVLIAESDETTPDGGRAEREPVGFALWFRNFSTWTGTHGVYLEDLYVRPHARRAGHGRALLATLAKICTDRGYERFEWSVLDWNEPSIAFYKSLGAEPLSEWTVHRMSGEPLQTLAALAQSDENPNRAISLSI